MSLIRSGLAIALALAVSGGGHLISAQQGLFGNGLGLYGLGPRLGENVALALEFQDQLGLSPEQVGSLQVLQSGIWQDVEPLEAEIAALRAGLMNGEVSWADGLVPLQDLLVLFEAGAATYRTQIEAVLTPAQHRALQGIMLETRPLQGWPSGAVGPNVGWDPGLSSGRGMWLGRGAVAGFGRGIGSSLARSGSLGMSRAAGRGFGRARGLRWR